MVVVVLGEKLWHGRTRFTQNGSWHAGSHHGTQVTCLLAPSRKYIQTPTTRVILELPFSFLLAYDPVCSTSCIYSLMTAASNDAALNSRAEQRRKKLLAIEREQQQEELEALKMTEVRPIFSQFELRSDQSLGTTAPLKTLL